MDRSTLLQRARASTFDANLVDDIVLSNDVGIFLLALRRSDCPPALLIDLSQSASSDVRLAVASHANTPAMTLRRLRDDKDPHVANTAQSRVEP
jgi:hypothetical protein